MTPYPTYKHSGLPWLGDIPAHWDVRRARFVFREVDERSVSGDEELLSVSHLTGVTPRSEKNVTMFMAASYVGHKLCHANDLVINSMWAWMGALGFAKQLGIVSSAYGVYRLRKPEQAVPSYYDYLLRTQGYAGEYLCRSRGIWTSRLMLNTDDFNDIPLILPPPAEQVAIVAFLDRKGAEIDRFLAAKRRLITLLREQKAALIMQAVTHGLNPDAPTKPSGVAWLGDVPAHWEMTPLKRITELQTGVTLGKIYTGPALETRNYLRVANVQSGYFDLSYVKTIDLPRDEVCRYELQSDDVLVTEGGDPDKLGRGFVWEGQLKGCLHQNHIFCLRPHSNKLLSHYLALCLQSSHGKTYFMFTSKQTTNLASTNSTTLKQFMVPLSPPNEQAAIVAYIDREGEKIDKAIARTEREMELIHEYRATLISEAVTGKWDVREASQNAPHAAPILST